MLTAYAHRPFEGGISSGSARPMLDADDYFVDNLQALADALGV